MSVLLLHPEPSCFILGDDEFSIGKDPISVVGNLLKGKERSLNLIDGLKVLNTFYNDNILKYKKIISITDGCKGFDWKINLNRPRKYRNLIAKLIPLRNRKGNVIDKFGRLYHERNLRTPTSLHVQLKIIKMVLKIPRYELNLHTPARLHQHLNIFLILLKISQHDH